MNISSEKMKKTLQIFFGLVGLALIIFVATREPKRPQLPRWEMQEKLLEKADEGEQKAADIALVKGLLREDLSKRRFKFSTISEAVSGKKMIPLGKMKSGRRVHGAISSGLSDVLDQMNSSDSPTLGLSRINEGSRFFEEGLLEGLDAVEGLKCEIPLTREGKEQRSGYPDLQITDEATGEVYYLDPKLMAEGSEDSSFRTFYFEPKDETLKINSDATHLLVGIEHDGVDGKWHFNGWRIVDLSRLTVRLKAEFQASNRDLYEKSPGLVVPAGSVK